MISSLDKLRHYLGCVALAFTLSATPALAVTINEVGASLDVCFDPTADPYATASALQSQGWVFVSDAGPEADAKAAMIWSLAVDGVAGTLTEKQVQTALNDGLGAFEIARANPIMNHFMIRLAGRELETVIVSVREDMNGNLQLECRFALSARSLFGHTGEDIAAPNIVNMGNEDVPNNIAIVLLNRVLLNSKIDTPVPINGVLSTSLNVVGP